MLVSIWVCCHVQGLCPELTIIRLLDGGWDPKVLLHEELGADLESSKLGNRGRSAELAGENIVLGVVRDHVLGDTVDNDGHGLLNEAILLEPV